MLRECSEREPRLRARPREPDRRAHRLQRRPRAAVRDRRGRDGAAEPIAGAEIDAPRADLGENDAFALAAPRAGAGWRAFVRGTVAELRAAGVALRGARLADRAATLPRGAGLSSSAALEVALCLALLARGGRAERRPRELARLCSRVENDWVGAQTGLLDQLAVAVRRDGPRRCGSTSARSTVEPVPLDLGDWRLVTLDSGERHAHAAAATTSAARECREACERSASPRCATRRADARRGPARAAGPPRAPRARRERARDAASRRCATAT